MFNKSVRWISQAKNREWIGWFLLFCAFTIGCLTLFSAPFGDEGDNLAVGALLAQGKVLYRDVFTHHFPFAYYWMAVVVAVTGKSFLTARLSILLFQIGALAAAMKLSRYYLVTGITALLWSIFRNFYLGNLVLYSSFSGVSLGVVFLIVLSLLEKKQIPDWRHWVALGGFSAVAILSDPLCVYPVALAMLLLFITRPGWGMKAGFATGVFLAVYGISLLATHTVQEFWQNAIVFNADIYFKYTHTSGQRFDDLWKISTSGIGINKPNWYNFQLYNPFGDDFNLMDQWFFTGFLYRTSIILTAVIFAFKKQFRSAIFIYFYAVCLLIINQWGYRTQPFVFEAFPVICALITHEWWQQQSPSRKPLRVFQVVIGLAALAIILVPVRQLSLRLISEKDIFQNKPGFVQLIDTAHYLEKYTCNEPGVLLAHYPAGTYFYWLTNMEPVAGYLYMWPWVAEVGLDDVIQQLEQENVLAMVVRQDNGLIWGKYDTYQYMAPLDSYLKDHYQQVTPGIYVSPELFSRCHPDQ